ncbi:MAG: hypothetical protein JWP97_790 [Labilithrix sp.]|nr:hypothetical protein [Labilithrix sp.]
MSRTAPGLSLLFVLAATAAAGPARAQSSADVALAEQLFRDGKQLREAKRYAEACPKFAESQRLAPTLGTQLNLARCFEDWGHTASAWGEYLEVARKAGTADPDRAKVARERAGSLEKVLSRVTVHFTQTVTGAVVSLDGKSLSDSLVDSAMPIDPGEHTLLVTAKGTKPWSRVLTVAKGPSSSTVEVTFESAGSASPAAGPGPVAPDPARGPSPTQDTRGPVGIALVSVGAAALVTGGIFGALALGKKSDFEGCQGSGTCADLPAARDAYDAAHTDALVSTIAVGVGVAAVAAGAYLLLTGGPRARTARVLPSTAAGGPGAVLSGSF